MPFLFPFELFIFALSYYLHPAILFILDHALEAKRIGYIDYPGSIANLLDLPDTNAVSFII